MSQKDAPTMFSSENLAARRRQLPLFLGTTYETTVQLLQIYEKLIPTLIHDQEVEAGVKVLHTIAESMRARLEPQVQKLGEDKQSGSRRAHTLRAALFPDEKTSRSTYEVLETLQGLGVYLAYMESSLEALQPVGLAMWDEEFVEALEYAGECVGRMRDWVRGQVKVRSPQTLLVPVEGGRGSEADC